jgi:hypothetical protein
MSANSYHPESKHIIIHMIQSEFFSSSSSSSMVSNTGALAPVKFDISRSEETELTPY